MIRPRMHADQLLVDEVVARRLVREQFPEWADLTLTPVASMGTVNAVFRLGDELALRLPLTPRWHDIDFEIDVLRRMAPLLPLTIPKPVAAGAPDDGYPWNWGIFRWLEGEPWRLQDVADPPAAARALAAFVRALQAVDPGGGRRSSRGGRKAFADADAAVRRSAEAARGMLDVDAFLAEWDDVRVTPGWAGEPVWIHGDLLAGNLLTMSGSIHAVIDWAIVSVGDPAHDLTPAWTLFDRECRDAFRRELAFDDDTWARARAWALLRIHGVAYYRESNPEFCADSIETLERVIADR